MDITMDNQQETDWAYLAGLLDGEGCISIGTCSKKNGHTQYNVCCRAVTNTNQALVDFVTETLAKYAIPFYVHRVNPKRANCKPYVHVDIAKAGMLPFLRKVAPYLKGKSRQAQLLYEYVCSRKTTFQTAQRDSTAWCYTEREHEIVRQLKALNGKGILNDFTLDMQLHDDKVSSEVESFS